MFACCMLLLLGFVLVDGRLILATQTDATIEAEIEGLRDQYRQRDLDSLSQIIGERIRRALAVTRCTSLLHQLFGHWLAM